MLSALVLLPTALLLPRLRPQFCQPSPRCCAATADTAADADAVARTRAWIEKVVMRLRLCPYAAEPYVDDQIRYAVSAATDDESLLEDFFLEGALLLDAPPELATTMLVAPQYAGDIEQFYALYEWLTDTLEMDDEDLLNNGIQPAFFHPDWNFQGLDEDDPIHFEKRAPHPTINLLRRSAIEAVNERGLAKGILVSKEISEHNAARLADEGWGALQAAFAQLAHVRDEPGGG